jgi:hypothetical protein
VPNRDGRPSDLKYSLENPTERASLRARCQGPRPLPAVLLASRPLTPRAISTRDDGVVFSTAAIVRPGVAAGPNA